MSSEDSIAPPSNDAMNPHDGQPDSPAPSTLDDAKSNGPKRIHRCVPSRCRSTLMLMTADLASMARSWLVRGFLLVSALVTVLALKGMQSEQVVASQMLEVVYTTYILIWTHGVVFIAGAALAREQDCLNDAILSRGITRGEFMGGKLLARCLATIVLIGIVLCPSSFWAIRQDRLVRTETGYISANAQNTTIEAWEPHKVFAEVEGAILEMEKEVGDAVAAGSVLALIDDRKLYDDLETERRAEQDARNEVDNAHRRYENAKRTVAQAEDAITRAERALLANDLLSSLEQSNRAGELRTRKRELNDAENQTRVARDDITKAERAVENAQAKVLAARKRLSHATVTAPVSGYLTEVLVQPSQNVGLGTHLFTVAPLDQYQVRVPIYNFNEFKRLQTGLDAYITVQGTEFKGTIDRLGAMTEKDRWGRKSNYSIVRFQGDGTLGLLGLDADVRMVLPPPEQKPNKAAALMNALTGHGEDDLESRTASVTAPWMLVALGKILGCACLLVTVVLFLLALFRNTLIAILSTIGLWHISNLLFDFAGLPELSYLEIVRNMDKVLGGIASPADEFAALAWLLALALLFGLGAMILFISRDPQK